MTRSAVCFLLVLAGCASVPTAWSGDAGGQEELSPRARAINHYLAGVIHRRNGRFEQAAEHMHQASDLMPESAKLALESAQVYLGLEDLQNARLMCERAVESEPENAALWVVVGVINQRLERYETAADAFRKAIELNPDDIVSYEALILAQEKTNDLTAVIDVFQQLVKIRPESAELHYQLGIWLARIDNKEQARQALEKALRLDPGYVRARYVLGLIYLEEGWNTQAAEQLRGYLAAEPDHVDAIENLAGALVRLGEPGEALGLLDGLIDKGLAEPGHHVQRMYLLIRTGRYGQAIDTPPVGEAPLLSQLMTAWARRLDGKPYVDLIEELDQLDADADAEAGEYLSELLFLFGVDDTGAFIGEALTQMREDAPPSRSLDLMLARVHMAMERYDDAETVLVDSLEKRGSGKWVHYYLAEIYETTGNVRGAEKQLRACLKADPEDPDVMNFLGYLYADHGFKLNRAEELLVRALKLDPGNPYYLDSLGWVYYKKGKGKRAVELIRQAILGMESDDAILRDHLGDAYLLTGDVERAVAQWRRAIRLDPALEGVRQKLEEHAKDGK